MNSLFKKARLAVKTGHRYLQLEFDLQTSNENVSFRYSYFGGLRKLYLSNTRRGIGVPFLIAGKKCN